MTVPVFEEYEPEGACGCAGCAERRRAAARPLRTGGHPAAHGARRVLVLATAAGVVLGGGFASATTKPPGTTRPPGAAPGGPGPATGADRAPGTLRDAGGSGADDGPDAEPVTEQGAASALHGAPGRAPAGEPPRRLAPLTRADIINRAKTWVSAQVPYSMERYWSDGYRQDCSGFVSMAWNLGTNEWTGSLAGFAVRISKEELQPGDILLFHNPDNPTRGSHVVIFGGWADYTHAYYVAYEQTPPLARKQATPYAYWNYSARYVPYRYKGLVSGAGGVATAEPAAATRPVVDFPGTGAFGPGADNGSVTRLGEMLVARGGKRFYSQGPGPRWSEADRRATEAFQRAQGWTGSGADGLPGPRTWNLLVRGTGRDIPPAAGTGATAARTAATATRTAAAPAYPGRQYFRPGRSGPYVTRLGERLREAGFGRYYTSGPGPRWSEADRRNVEAFQRAQGWRGAAADGYPGPETWRRLFAALPAPSERRAPRA
ncbi:peptidoglycan-binding protein [Streptomyces sp. NPDC059070]|uniref:peptidoglycan-binding protein n=1 Tax=Streptomyces sp. NPDC059070 TaxID=3346713 RepID=UPI0036A4121F